MELELENKKLFPARHKQHHNLTLSVEYVSMYFSISENIKICTSFNNIHNKMKIIRRDITKHIQ